jgi:carotenoid cleavage dioxygenase-like enzyme
MASNLKPWSKALAQPAKEFSPTALPILSGKIPNQLRGTLYRNGPGRLQRGDRQVGHWFDGDGAILAVHFTEKGASGLYRYVQTIGYQKEEKADTFLYSNYGMTAAGGFWNNWLRGVKNAANTSVLALPDRLLALWEAGLPYVLDLETLETWGTDNLSILEGNQPFSAHPKIDSATGEIFNFGVSAGLNSQLNLYRCNSQGKIEQKNVYPLSGLPLIHDFVLAGQYLVFFVSPVRINFLPVILGSKCFSDAMEWKPELGTEILIFDRDTLSLVNRSQAEPWYQWHFSNGYVDRHGEIAIEFVRYKDFQTNQHLKEVATGQTKTPAKGTLWQLRLNPQTGKVLENRELLDRSCEFPIVYQNEVGQPWRYTYISIHRDESDIGKELLNAIAGFDRQTGNLVIADMGENRYPTEPIYVPHPEDPQRGWILTVVYDGNTDSSEVRIYQSDRLEDEPICRLGLPSVVPPSFHGTWKDSIS